MLITLPISNEVKENDLLALTKDNRFIGYGVVKTILNENIILDVDKKVGQMFNELDGEHIPYNFKINGEIL